MAVVAPAGGVERVAPGDVHRRAGGDVGRDQPGRGRVRPGPPPGRLLREPRGTTPGGPASDPEDTSDDCPESARIRPDRAGHLAVPARCAGPGAAHGADRGDADRLPG